MNNQTNSQPTPQPTTPNSNNAHGLTGGQVDRANQDLKEVDLNLQCTEVECHLTRSEFEPLLH